MIVAAMVVMNRSALQDLVRIGRPGTQSWEEAERAKTAHGYGPAFRRGRPNHPRPVGLGRRPDYMVRLIDRRIRSTMQLPAGPICRTRQATRRGCRGPQRTAWRCVWSRGPRRRPPIPTPSSIR